MLVVPIISASRYLRPHKTRAWACRAGQGLAVAAALTSPWATLAQGVTQAVSLVDGYEVLADGLALRASRSRLEWMRCALGQQWNGAVCTGQATEFTFEGAQQEALVFNQRGGLAGQADWRVPTARELASLIHCGNGKTEAVVDLTDGGTPVVSGCSGDFAVPTALQTVFPEPSADARAYWTSSLMLGESSFKGWYVDFRTGHIGVSDDGGARFAVRLVRAGAPGGVKPDAQAGKGNDPASASSSAQPVPSPCARLAMGMAVRVRVLGYPQPQAAMVLSTKDGVAELRVMQGSAAGRRLSVACSDLRR